MGPLTVRPAAAVDYRAGGNQVMPQSRLFVSSVSRRQLARRRQRRPRLPVPLLAVLALLVAAALAFAVGHGF
jgi:hypothetical protein